MINFKITNHAVEMYRQRVLACSECVVSDGALRAAIRRQLDEYPMMWIAKALHIIVGPWRPKKKKWWEQTVDYPAHIFVVHGDTVVTTLGYMMQPISTVNARNRRQLLARTSNAVVHEPDRRHR